MRDCVKDYVRSCQDCQTRNFLLVKPAGLLQPTKVGSLFEKWAVDLIGPVIKSKDGMRYIIICTEYLSKWVETRPIPNANGEHISKFLIEAIYLKFGAPRVLLSDLGRSFLSDVVEETLMVIGTRHMTSLPYTPRCNGLVEKVNQILIGMLSKYIDQNQKNWSTMVKFLTNAYNTSVHSSTGFSPFYLLYGIQNNQPTEIGFSNGIQNAQEHVQEIHTSLKKA